MDPNRFDNWARNRAARLSRRDALKLAGASVSTAALVSTAPVLAQASCRLTLHAETLAGPSAPTVYDGTLEFQLGSDGAITTGAFTTAAGDAHPVSSQTAGRALDVLISLGGNQTLILSGTGAEAIAACPASAAGILTGPQPGDFGAWQSTMGTSAGAAPSSGSASSSAGSSSASSGQSSLSCPAPQTSCGQACCPGGATCTDAGRGLCACPPGTEQCGAQCVPGCPDGQLLDLDSCSCTQQEAACSPNQQTCQNHGQCCSGYCGGGTCFDCVGKVCGDFGCVDPMRDSQNCGNCGNVCVYPQICNGGVCGCAPDDTPCIDHSECCSQLCTVFGTCKSCSSMSTGGANPQAATFCGPGVCTDLRWDIFNCGTCFNECPGSPESTICENGVCHDFNVDPYFCGRSGAICPPPQICHLGECIQVV